MAKATWNGFVIAESNNTVVVEGNLYFPLASLDQAYFKDSDHTSICGWKGTANYFHIEVDGKMNENAAWIYRDPKAKAAEIKNHVAFWRGVEIEP